MLRVDHVKIYADLNGDTTTAKAEVISVHETKPAILPAFKIIRQDGEIVLEEKAWCYTFSAED
jgi:hypothetical protein